MNVLHESSLSASQLNIILKFHDKVYKAAAALQAREHLCSKNTSHQTLVLDIHARSVQQIMRTTRIQYVENVTHYSVSYSSLHKLLFFLDLNKH